MSEADDGSVPEGEEGEVESSVGVDRHELAVGLRAQQLKEMCAQLEHDVDVLDGLLEAYRDCPAMQLAGAEEMSKTVFDHAETALDEEDPETIAYVQDFMDEILNTVEVIAERCEE